MSVAVAAGFSSQAFEQFLGGLREPEWSTDRRRQAWQRFAELPMPDRTDEEWKRTDLRAFAWERFGPPEPWGGAELPPALLREGVELGGQHTTANSRTLEAHLDRRWISQGVVFGDLEQASVDHSELIQKHLDRTVEWQADRFDAAREAFRSGGTLLYVPRGVVVDQPLHMFAALGPGGVDLSHTLVVLEDGAEATLLAETASLDSTADGLHCGAVELCLGRGSRLRYVHLQNWGRGVWHFARQEARLGGDASLQWTIGALGARLAKVNQQVRLDEPGAAAQVNGVMFTEGRQHLAYHTRQDHNAAHCHSDLLYKGALQDKSRIVWRGMIHVAPGAQKTDAYQRDDNLILSEAARADSIPGLEIQADDVRCSHGATIGRVDDELLFYAQTRGLSRKEATRMIVAGFFQQVFDRITIPSVQEALAEAIGRRVREYQPS